VDAANVVEAKHRLAHFHTKFNKSLAEKLVVEAERDRLTKENYELMMLLKQVL